MAGTRPLDLVAVVIFVFFGIYLPFSIITSLTDVSTTKRAPDVSTKASSTKSEIEDLVDLSSEKSTAGSLPVVSDSGNHTGAGDGIREVTFRNDFSFKVDPHVTIADMKGSITNLQRDPCMGRRDFKQRPCSVRIAALPVAFVSAGWTVDKSVGKGGFGQVFKLVNTKTKEVAALKVAIPSDRKRSTARKGVNVWDRAGDFLEREADVFLGVASQHSPYLCSLKNTLRVKADMSSPGEQPNFVYPLAIVTEWFDQGDLKDKELSREQVLLAFYHATMGLRDLHRAGYIHADLKPANLLMKSGKNGEGPTVAVCDFGLARFRDPNQDTRCSGTETFKAPEAKLCCGSRGPREFCDSVGGESTKQDIFSLVPTFNRMPSSDFCQGVTMPNCRTLLDRLKDRRRQKLNNFQENEEMAMEIRDAEIANGKTSIWKMLASMLTVAPEDRIPIDKLEDAVADYLENNFPKDSPILEHVLKNKQERETFLREHSNDLSNDS